MADLRKCEFFLLRYVPDAVKDEFVNIGVLMLDASQATGEPFAQIRFTDDWSRVRCIDPVADIEVLEGFGEAVRAELARGHEGRESLLKRLNDSFSNLIQIATAKACLTESPQQEVELLAKLYLQSPPLRKAVSERNAGARARIVSEMRDCFEGVGVWRLMWKKIPASEYTQPGDPLKIDCGYKPNGTVKMFHALALENEIDSAKILAFSYPAIKEGVARKLAAAAELTAIINTRSSFGEPDAQVAFALETLAAAGIQVGTVADLARYAEAARRDMRL
jgi:hypothetical protein